MKLKALMANTYMDINYTTSNNHLKVFKVCEVGYEKLMLCRKSSRLSESNGGKIQAEEWWGMQKNYVREWLVYYH